MVGGVKGKPDGWQSAPKKLNDQEKPLFLCVPANVVLNGGIDSAWLTGRAKPQQFAICEAKAKFITTGSVYTLLSEAQDKSGAGVGKGGGGLKSNKKPVASSAGAPSSKPAKPMMMQMSHEWIKQRVEKSPEYRFYKNQILLGNGNYTRHVFLITPIQAAKHVAAFAKILSNGLVSNPAGAQVYAKDHAKHDVEREFGEADLDAADKTYKAQGKYKSPSKKKTKGKKR